MSKRPHTKYDKSDAEIDEMVNRQLTAPTTSNISNELDDILNNLDISDFPNRSWSDSAKQALSAYIEREKVAARVEELRGIAKAQSRWKTRQHINERLAELQANQGEDSHA